MKDSALYLEVDEDITSAIDKLSKTSEPSVQIVVPKRSTMLQSIINLKLLKKAADNSGKELVLVTSDRIATDLAARVGLAVAPSIGAKPVITEAHMPESLKSNEEIIDADDPEPPPLPDHPPKAKPAKRPLLRRMQVSDGPPGPPPAPSAPAGVLAPLDPAAASESAAPPPVPATKAGPKVPNFGKLQRRVMWVAGAAVMIGGYLLAMYFFTTAKITLYATGTKVSIDTTFTADPTAKTTDAGKLILAAQPITVTKDLTGPFAPTGKKDVGTKASGNMVVYNEYDTNAHDLVAGTRFQAPDGKTFRTKADATVPGATVGLSGGQIVLSPGKSDPVPVEADQAGDTYNEAPSKYTIPGYSGPMQAKIYGQGAQMSGGTSKTVTVVALSDVDTEKAALLAKDKDASARDIAGKVPAGYIALPASQSTSTDQVNSSPAVDSAGDTASLALKVTYSVLAVKKADYAAVIHAQEEKQVGAGSQIYDDGLGSAQVTDSDKDSSGRQSFHFTTEAYGGAKLDKAAIAGQLKGQRFGDANRLATGLPGVTRADIAITPAWVSKLPSRPDKITITVQVANAQ